MHKKEPTDFHNLTAEPAATDSSHCALFGIYYYNSSRYNIFSYKIFHFGDTHAPTHTIFTLSLGGPLSSFPVCPISVKKNFPFNFSPPIQTFRPISSTLLHLWHLKPMTHVQIETVHRRFPLKFSAHSSAFSVRREKRIFSSYWIVGKLGGRQNSSSGDWKSKWSRQK